MFAEGVLVWREVVRRLAGLGLVVVVDGKRKSERSEAKRSRRNDEQGRRRGDTTTTKGGKCSCLRKKIWGSEWRYGIYGFDFKPNVQYNVTTHSTVQ